MLAFDRDPGCEIPIRRYPNDFDKKVGAITAESTFIITCVADLPPPGITGGIQESKQGDITTGFVELGFENPDPAIAPFMDGLEMCPPSNPDV